MERLVIAGWVAALALLIGCGGKTVVDEPGGGGSTSSSSSSGTTTTTSSQGCPTHPPPEQGTTCSTPGSICPGTGSDPYCWDWTCVCADSLVFQCSPGACE